MQRMARQETNRGKAYELIKRRSKSANSVRFLNG